MAVVCAGEVLVDRWPDGTECPGGAPANVAFHAAGLGAEACLITRTGDDPAGRRLRAWLRDAGVSTVEGPADAAWPTGTVTVDPVSPGGPRYDIDGPAAWDHIAADGPALDLARRARVFVIGTLAQRHPVSRAAIRELAVVARGAGARVLADLNLRAPFYDGEILFWTLRHCSVLKLNRDELAEVSGLLGAAGCEEDLFTGLLREFGIPCGVLTAGADGAWIHEEGTLSHQPAVPVATVDPVGAGDAFCAALAAGLDRGGSLRAAAPQAAHLAALVVSRRGATAPGA
jgi:fructokinase